MPSFWSVKSAGSRLFSGISLWEDPYKVGYHLVIKHHRQKSSHWCHTKNSHVLADFPASHAASHAWFSRVHPRRSARASASYPPAYGRWYESYHAVHCGERPPRPVAWVCPAGSWQNLPGFNSTFVFFLGAISNYWMETTKIYKPMKITGGVRVYHPVVNKSNIRSRCFSFWFRCSRFVMAFRNLGLNMQCNHWRFGFLANKCRREALEIVKIRAFKASRILRASGPSSLFKSKVSAKSIKI